MTFLACRCLRRSDKCCETQSDNLNTSSPYFRSFLVSGIFFVAVAWKMVSRHTGHWSPYPSSHFVGVGFAALVSGLLVGLIASRFERWQSWWTIGAGTIVGWSALMGLMLLIMRLAYPTTNDPKFSNAGEMMKYFASEAAQWVKQDKGIDLNYSFDSINLIEEQLAQLSKTVDKANPQPGMRGQAMGYGAYVGEVLRRKDGGFWSADHPNAG